jgi:hypothetical protein
MARNAYIFIQHFGSHEEQIALAEQINAETPYKALVRQDCVFIDIKLHEIAQFFDVIQSNDNFNWIEFTVQLDVLDVWYL